MINNNYDDKYNSKYYLLREFISNKFNNSNFSGQLHYNIKNIDHKKKFLDHIYKFYIDHCDPRCNNNKDTCPNEEISGISICPHIEDNFKIENFNNDEISFKINCEEMTCTNTEIEILISIADDLVEDLGPYIRLEINHHTDNPFSYCRGNNKCKIEDDLRYIKILEASRNKNKIEINEIKHDNTKNEDNNNDVNNWSLFFIIIFIFLIIIILIKLIYIL